MTNVLIRLCLPIEHKDAGNRLAAIIDPGTRGGETFGGVLCSATGEAPATHVMCSTWMVPEYADVLRSRDPAQYMTALTALAEERDRDLPLLADCEDFCDNVLIDDEITVQRIPVDLE